MTCEEARKLFVDEWRGMLTDAAHADLNAHVAICERCASESAGLARVWSALGHLPELEPSGDMRMRFYDNLRGLRLKESERSARSWWRHPAFAVACSMASLIVGVLVGGLVTHQSSDVAQLRGELSNMRQLVTLSLLQQQSAGDRLRGVNWSYRVEQSDTEVLAALLTTVNHDPNVNVRLAAVDALHKFSDSPVARKGLIQALAKQTSPLVQIAILDQVVDLHERTAAPAVRFLLGTQDLNPDVRQRADWALKQLQ
jgi:hypothetical protein